MKMHFTQRCIFLNQFPVSHMTSKGVEAMLAVEEEAAEAVDVETIIKIKM